MNASAKTLSPALAGAAAGGNPANRFLIAGIVLLTLSFIGMLTLQGDDPSRPFAGWLIGVAFWLSILVGMLFLTMIWWMFDSGWSVIIRRQLEHAMAAFPWIAVALLPLIVFSALRGTDPAVAWTWMNLDALVPGGSGTVGQDPLYVHKAGYLNTPFFVVRFVVVFAVFIGLAHALRSWSFSMDTSGDHKFVHRSRVLSAFGLFLCAIATSVAAIDWFKTLSYHWFSTMYGVWFFSASMRAALSAIVLLLFYQASRNDGLRGIVKPAHFHLVGCIMLAFTIFWAYISFCQYFLIYNANIPEETFWYNIRELAKDGSNNSWWYVSLVLVFLHFLVPFLFLLFYANKFGSRLKFIAVWILVFHLLDIYWNIVPQKLAGSYAGSYSIRGFGIHPVDITVLLGTGALVIYAYLKSAATHRAIPVRDPRIDESIHCHE
jgi:hypothetical protein